MSTNHWLIVYDIRDKKRLSKVEKIAVSYGWRLQNSIFESDAEEGTIQAMESKLAQTIEEEDFILIFHICEKDWQKREKYGKAGGSNPMTGKFMIL